MKPWPLTMGQVPLYYATKTGHFPPSFGHPDRAPEIFPDSPLAVWQQSIETFLEYVLDLFLEDGISISLFGWVGVRFYNEVANKEDGRRFLAKIFGFLHVWKIVKLTNETEFGKWSVEPSLDELLPCTWIACGLVLL